MITKCLPIRAAAVMIALFLFAQATGFAQELPVLFHEVSGQISAQDLKHSPSDSIRVKVDFTLISPSKSAIKAVSAPLPGKTVVLLKDRIVARGTDDYTWFGKVRGRALSSAVITVVNGVMYGHVNLNGETYSIEPSGTEYLIIKHDATKKVPFGNDTLAPKIKKKLTKSSALSSYPFQNPEDGSHIDVLVLYTQQMLDKYGQAGLAAMIQQYVQITQNAYTNSSINTTLNLVGAELYNDVSADENTFIEDALSYLTCNTIDSAICQNENFPKPPAKISELREKYKADLVSLLRVANYYVSPYCGLAWVMQDVDTTFADFAFSVVEVRPYSETQNCGGSSDPYCSGYCDDTTLAHELGHNMGCAHDRDHTSNPGAYPYSYGYDRQLNGKGIFGTIMSYDGPTITYFSTPLKTYLGYPIGVSGGDDGFQNPSTSADNARSINNTKVTVANFRISGSLAITVTAGSKRGKIYLSGQPDPIVPFGTDQLLSNKVTVFPTDNIKTFTITPDAGYHIALVTGCGGTLSVNSYTTAAITADCTVEVSFAIDPGPDAGISVSPASKDFGSVNIGTGSSTQAFTISNTGTSSLIIDSIVLTGGNKEMFSVAAGTCQSLAPTIAPGSNCSIDVTFAPVSAGQMTTTLRIVSNSSGNPSVDTVLKGTGAYRYTLSISKPGTGKGVVTSSPAGISCGADCSWVYDILNQDTGLMVSLTATPDPGSIFSAWSGYTSASGNQSTVTVKSDTTVAAIFTLTHTINVKSGSGGSITPSGVLVVNDGADQTFVIAPEAKYHVTDVLVDGVSKGVLTSYTFKGVTSDHTIEAVFEINADTGAQIDVSPGSHDFVSAGLSQTFTIKSTGSSSLAVSSISLSGTDAGMFKIGESTCQSLSPSIPAGSSCSIIVSFNPASTGLKSAALLITSNAYNSPNTNISLSGTYKYNLWARTYGGDGEDKADSVLQTADGGFIVAGRTNSFGSGKTDIWLLKLDAGGDIQWQKAYGGPMDDYPGTVRQTQDGGYVLAGRTSSFSGGDVDLWLLKLDSTGSIEWQRAYGGTGSDNAISVLQTADGYAIAGTTSSYGAGYSDLWVLKTDTSGIVQWQKTYGGDGTDMANSMQQTADGGYILAGQTNSFGAGYADAWVLKLDASGNIHWQKTYGGTQDDSANNIQQTSDGGFIVAGQTNSFGAGYSDAWILKLDASGNIQWQKAYGGTQDDYANSIQQTNEGGYIVAGQTSSFGAGNSDAWLLKLDAVGNIQWQKTYGGPQDDYLSGVQQTADGGFISAGQTSSFGAGNGDFWVLKIDGNGNINDCSNSGISDAVITDTSASAKNTLAITAATDASSQSANALTTSTSAKEKVLCYSDQALFSLKVTKAGTGTGKIMISSSGMDCSNGCTVAYNVGSSVTLSATPNKGSAFSGWSGAECSGTGTCQVTLEADTTITATFAASKTYAISGKILSGGKQPLAGVTVMLTGDSISSAVTDDHGKYSFTGLAGGTYSISANMSGYSFSPASRSVKINKSNAASQNFSTFSISGIIKSGKKKPLAGAVVVLGGDGANTATTDSTGKYSFNGLSSGKYTVTPGMDGYTFSPASRSIKITKTDVPVNFRGEYSYYQFTHKNTDK